MGADWNIKELLLWTTGYFQNQGLSRPRLEAELLLAHVLEKDRVYLYANYDAPSTATEREAYRDLIKRRAMGEPLAYITGCKEFMSIEFAVSPAVLIPRPETELLVEQVIDLVRASTPKIVLTSDTAIGNSDENSQLEPVADFSPERDRTPIMICDVGTGSGAIAVSLAHYLPEAQIFATEISPAALEIARTNASRQGVEVEYYQGDLLEPLQEAGPFDIIVANLPYIPADEYRALERGILDHEPREALLAAGDGLDIYRRLMPQAIDLLVPGGYLLLEIGSQQGEAALDLMIDFVEAELLRDLAGRERIIKARKKGGQLADTVYQGEQPTSGEEAD